MTDQLSVVAFDDDEAVAEATAGLQETPSEAERIHRHGDHARGHRRQAYQGQAPFIKSSAVFKAAISIHPVEARHAAWIRNLAGQNPAPAAFNPVLTKDQVLAAVGATGFIK
jgi:hypothetical protein